MTTRHQSARRRGLEIQRRAKALLEADGCRVEIAPAVTKWIPKDKGPRVPGRAMVPGSPGLIPISTRHDFFGLFDLVYVRSSGERGFAQVTTVANVGPRRVRLLAAHGEGFPLGPPDLLMACEQGHTFKVMRYPLWADAEAERWTRWIKGTECGVHKQRWYQRVATSRGTVRVVAERWR